MKGIKFVYFALLMIGFSIQIGAKEALDTTAVQHLKDDIYTSISSNKINLCQTTTNTALDDLIKEKVKTYGYDDAKVGSFLEGFKESIKTGCSGVTQLTDKLKKSIISYGVKDGNKELVVKSPEQKQLDDIYSQLQSIQTVILSKEKKIIIPKEIEQLEYMILGRSETGDMQERLNNLGNSFYSTPKGKKYFTDLPTQIEKVNDLRTKLGHKNWKSDMYWVGGSVMSVPSIKAMTMGIALHAYPWYARAIQASITEADDFARRFSIYVDIGSISGNTDYTGATYGVGIGFDIREGFIIKAGGIYKKSANATGTYGYNNTVGITITSEFFKELIGG